jgi:CheY-like chemotaxis protein
MDDNKGKILLAEDDPEFRDLLAFCLFQAGYSVTACDNGFKLQELLDDVPDSATADYDLVLTDWRMPGLTGLEVLEAFSDRPGRPPFVCMTAYGDQHTHETAARLGAAFTVDKPVDLDYLISRIDSLLEDRKKQKCGGER